MSDLDIQLLLDALTGKSVAAAIENENPYSSFAAIPGATTKAALGLALKDPTSENIRESAAIGAVSGLFDGLLSSKSRDYSAEKYGLMTEGMLTGNRPEGISDALWSVIGSTRQKARYSERADLIERLKDRRQAGWEAAAAERAKRDIDEIPIFDEEGKIVATEKSLTHPHMKEQTDILGALADDFRLQSRDFRRSDIGVRAMVKAFEDREGTSDYELIRRAAQAVEPGLAVRKDDQDSIIQAAGIFGQSIQTLKNAMSGETRLTPEVRAGIMRIGFRGYAEHKRDFERVQEMFKKRGSRAGITDPGLYMDILETDEPSSLWSLFDSPIDKQEAAAKAILNRVAQPQATPPPIPGYVPGSLRIK